MPDSAGKKIRVRSKRPLWMPILAAALTFIGVFGLFVRQNKEAQSLNSPTAPAGLLPPEQSSGTALVSVGKVTGLPLPCTAWLVDAGAAPDARAYAVTAGRCVGVDDAATVRADVSVNGASIDFNTFATLTSAAYVAPVTASITDVEWASARGTDLAVLRLGTTYGALADQGVLPIAPVAPLADGGQILVPSVPVEGVPADQQHLRGSRCAIGVTTDVAEQPWLFHHLRASDCDGILGGSAGAPALNPEGQAVGMVVTTTIAAPDGPDCSVGRPCEARDGTVGFHADTTYLTPVDLLAGCFPKGTFATGPDCALEDPASVVQASVGSSTWPAGGAVRIEVDDPPSGLQAQAGPLGSTDCWADQGYAKVTPDATDAITVTAPTKQGLAVACVRAAGQPTPLLLTITGSAPDASAIALSRVPVEGGVEVAPVPDPPTYASFTWAMGPAGSTDCAKIEGYAESGDDPVLIQSADLPATVCVIARDAAGTPSAPSAFQLG